jgi:hypothetical protein
MMRSALLCMTALLSLACRSVTQQGYVLPAANTVFVETDERQRDPPVHLVSIVNLSSDPVFVWSISLDRCENIKQPCVAQPVEIRIPPKGRHLAMRVEPALQEHRFSYRVRFAWRVDSLTNTIVRPIDPPRP